jgi:hypothetical protein
MSTEIVGDPKVDATHYGDRPDNKDTPPKHVAVEEHTAGSEHHPARNGRHVKSQIDHAIELDDKIEELKHDVSKENIKGNSEKAKELDKEMSHVMQERESLEVPI